MAKNLSSKGYSSSKSGSAGTKTVTTTKITLPTKTTGQNLTSKGYPSSVGTQNLSSKGYSSSRSGSAGTGNISTTKVTLPKTSSSSSSSGSSSYSGGYSTSGYSRDYDNDYDYGGSSSSESYDNGYDATEAYNAMLAAYAKQKADYEKQLAEQRAAAQNAYDRGMNNLNSAYNSQMSSLSSNLNEAKNQMLKNYNLSKNNISSDAENSLRQAYINRMLSEKNLGQQMSAMGLNGGATETTLAGMLNNYGNARNSINNTANNNLSNLENNYNNNLAQAAQAYNSAVASVNSQKAQQAQALENALASNQISALANYQDLLQRDNQNYLDLLKTAVANGVNLKYDPTSAENAVQAVSYQQASNPNASTNYAALQALQNAIQNATKGTNSVSLGNTATTSNYLADILKQLGG